MNLPMSQCKPGLDVHAKSTIMYDYPVTLNTLANVSSMSLNAILQKFEMVGGYTEDLTKPQNCQIGGSCMHRNGYLLVYIYSSIIYIYEETHGTAVGHKWGALIRAVIMSKECTQPFMQMFPSVKNYFSTGLVMTLQSECICMP